MALDHCFGAGCLFPCSVVTSLEQVLGLCNSVPGYVADLTTCIWFGVVAKVSLAQRSSCIPIYLHTFCEQKPLPRSSCISNHA